MSEVIGPQQATGKVRAGQGRAKRLRPIFAPRPPERTFLQRQCACGNHTISGGDCPACRTSKDSTPFGRSAMADLEDGIEASRPVERPAASGNGARIDLGGIRDFSRVPVQAKAGGRPRPHTGYPAVLTVARINRPHREARPGLTGFPRVQRENEGEQNRPAAGSDEAAAVLNHDAHTTTAYQQAISNWPNSQPIWPRLTSREAKVNFIRFIVHFDLTNCRPYSPGQTRTAAECSGFSRAQETFANLCQGYATQMYARYSSDRSGLSQDALSRMQSVGHIYENQTAPKFRMPMLIATAPGHAFNAIQVGPSASSISSYLFLEPQTDQLFDHQSPQFQRYFRVGIMSLSRLTGYTQTGSYQQQDVASFIRGATGAAEHAQLSQSQIVFLRGMMRDVFIADDWDSWRSTVLGMRPDQLSLTAYIGRLRTDAAFRDGLPARYNSYIQGRVQGHTDANLALLGRLVIGRTFKRYFTGPEETMSQSVFLQLINRPAVGQLLQRAANSPATPSGSETTQ